MRYIRFQLLAVGLWLLAMGSLAQTNVLRVQSEKCPAGKTLSLPIVLENESDITGVQFDLSIPYELVADEAGNLPVTLAQNRAPYHKVATKYRGSEWRGANNHGGVNYYHVYRIIVYSDKNDLIIDNSGTLLTVDVPLSPDAANGAVFPIYLLDKSVTLSDRQKQNVLTSQEDGTITVEVIPRPDLQPTDVTFEPSTANPEGELTVKWKVANIGQVATEAGWSEQIALVALTGGVTKQIATTYYDQTLSAGGSVSRETKVVLPALLGIDGLAKVQVTVMPNENAGEHPSLRDNNVATGSSNLTVGKRLTLELTPQRLVEGYNQRISCKLSRSGRWQNIRSFTLKTNDTRLQIPNSVTIPANQSGVVFYATLVNNTELDADSVATITASGDGYDAVTSSIIIEDDELPALKLTASKSDVNEGETFQLTLTVDKAPKSDVVVKLTSEDSKHFQYPQEVTIPAGQTSVTVNVTAVQNEVPNLEQANKFTVSAARYEKGEVIVVLKDDDMPLLTLTLTPNVVSEQAGPTAVAAVLTRTGKTDTKITVRISDDSNGGLYYQHKSIEMAKGVETVNFNLGPVDNTIKEGDRTYTLTAGVWVSSCGCASSGEQAGNVSAQLTVLDNDGASLAVTSQQSTVKEGDETKLTITRNTVDDVSQPLAVTLSSDYDAELTYEHNVTIPAGQTSVEVAVQTKKNDFSGDSHTVIFTVAAEGFGSGTCFLLVTDQTLPDARITSLTSDVQQAVVGGSVVLTAVVSNEGAAVLPTGTSVKFYKRGVSEPLGIMMTQEDVAVNATTTLLRTIPLPEATGNHVYYCVVNEDRLVNELVYSNNTSADVTVKGVSPFRATVTTDKKVYTQGEKVVITGKLTGERTTNAKADIYFINDGARQTERITTDADGAFTHEWTPYALQSGHFVIGACFPDDATTEEMTSIDVYGLRRVSSAYITEDVIVGDTRQGVIELQNPGTLGLTGVKAEKLSGPDAVSVELDVPSTIAGNSNASLTYRLTGSEGTVGNDWEQIIVRVTTAEGVKLDIVIYYYGRVATGNLVVASHQLTTTMHKDTGRDYTFFVTNNGRGNTGKITLALPDWMKALTGVTMAGLNQNDTANVVLRLMPTSDMQLNVPVTGRIGINCENGNGTYINYVITPVSDQKGTLVVDVTDEYTYYTEEAPHVKGAQVVIRNPYTQALVAQGVTGDDGLFRIDDLPEGYYRINVTADKHGAYQNDILVDPGTTTTKVVTLQYQAISVSWDVVETEVEDEYNIVTTVQYETNVPAPVIEMIAPDRIDADKLGVGESLVFNVIVTNKGLITGKNSVFYIPDTLSNYKWEALVDCNGREIAPQQSIIIPVKVTRLADESASATRRAGSSDKNCHMEPRLVSEYECGPDGHIIEVKKTVQFQVCKGKDSAGGGGGGVSYGYGPGGPNGGWYTVYGQETNYNHTKTNDDCRDCGAKTAKWAVDCAASFVPGGGGCAYGLAAGGATIMSGEAGTMDYITTGLTGVGCTLEVAGAVIAATGVGAALGGIIGGIGIGINVLNCILSFNYGCLFNPPGGGFSGAKGAVGGDKAKAMRRASAGEQPSYVTRFSEVSAVQLKMMTGFMGYYSEVFGDTLWLYNTSYPEMYNVLMAVKNQNAQCTLESLKPVQPENISDAMMERFIERLNNTNDYVANKTPHDNMISAGPVIEYLKWIEEAEEEAHQLGYPSCEEMWKTESDKFIKETEKGSNSVCSTITLQINQTMTMTRQAFRGTLTVYNGSKTEAMENVKLTLNVTNLATGEVATVKEFEMHTESLVGFKGELPMDAGWHLGADSTGTATILFIPSKYAAPEEPIEYSFGGTLSYIDPFTGLEVTRELYPVTLTVKPSPELDLTYFMQRDIMGDDALTEEVEPMEPSEFALIINNKGNGDATNVKMVTNQPEIIDNQKGLLIDFEFLSSQLNGQDKTLALGQAIPTDFGTIPAHTQAYAQWWLQSTLLGHFVKYDIEATHVTSYGNENLSLLDQVTIHELIRGFTPSPLGAQTPSAGRAFLVNDVTDADDTPDAIYFTDATQDAVYELASATLDKQSDTEYHLTLVPTQAGWSYGNLMDPTVGRQKLTKIVRKSDGAEMNLDNLWQTNRTLRDGLDPVKENRLHFVANMSINGETFILTFAPKPDVELAVKEFVGVPKEGTVATEPVKQLTVRFNKAIDASTFTTDDVTLALQGKQLDASKVVITKDNDTDYTLNLEAATGGDGYYVLTVQTAQITDTEGFNGAVGKQATWVQFAGGKVTLAVKAEPAEGGSVTPASGQYDFGQTVNLQAVAAEGYDFVRWMEGDKALSDSANYIYAVQGNADLTAVFTPKYLDVTVSYDERGGSVTGGGTGRYTYGTELTLTATPLTGWQFDGWTVDGKAVTTDLSSTFNVQSSMTIQAVFTEQPAGLLSGRVTRDTDDVPIGGAKVILRCGDVSYAATTDAYGYYQLRVEDKSLTYDLLCQADGFMWSPTAQIWFDETEQTKNFSLLRGATVVIPAEWACTFSSPVPVTPTTEGVRVWYLSKYDQQSFVVDEYTEATIPAGEGVILSGSPGQRIDLAEAAAVNPIMGNMLIGTPTAPYVVSDDAVYKMGEGTSDVAKFYLMAKDEVVPKGKAYCQYTLSSQAATVDIIWSAASLINAVLRDINDPDTPHFDLQGRRIYKTDADTRDKKIHVVKGRKVIIK